MRDVGKVYFVHGPKSHQVCVCIHSLYHGTGYSWTSLVVIR
jgi:hypothetical protein